MHTYVMLFCAGAVVTQTDSGKLKAHKLQVGGLERVYFLHVPHSLPKGRPAALVLVFHGGSGNPAGTERLTGFSAVADREGFIVVYPEGIGKNWNDGRGVASMPAQRDNVDDVAYTAAVIDAVAKEHAVNPKQVFATGISNGGMFCHYLAAKLSPRIAAIAPVVGGIADPFHKEFRPQQPVSAFIIQGTKDPLVPYEGGGVLRGRRGKIISTDAAVKLWVQHNGCNREPQTGRLPDKSPDDGCTVHWSTWPNGRNGTEVTLYTIENGGHTWPGGPQYLSERFIGKVCRDFNASDAIWDFFKKHGRK